MSKSILIVNTPKCCFDCDLWTDDTHCFRCIVAGKKYEDNSIVQEWCPLRTPLKAVDKDYYIYRTDYLFEHLDREIELLESTKRFKEHMKNRGETE